MGIVRQGITNVEQGIGALTCLCMHMHTYTRPLSYPALSHPEVNQKSQQQVLFKDFVSTETLSVTEIADLWAPSSAE